MSFDVSGAPLLALDVDLDEIATLKMSAQHEVILKMSAQHEAISAQALSHFSSQGWSWCRSLFSLLP